MEGRAAALAAVAVAALALAALAALAARRERFASARARAVAAGAREALSRSDRYAEFRRRVPGADPVLFSDAHALHRRGALSAEAIEPLLPPGAAP